MTPTNALNLTVAPLARARPATGLRPGRTSADEIFIFDSTGVAIEDVAAAALVYERAVATDTGTVLRIL